jgi:hypothetical protein
MSGLSPTSLIALQSYGAADTARRQHQPQRETQQPQPPRFNVEDSVTLRAPEPAKKTKETKETGETQKSPPEKHESGVGRREAVNPGRPAYKRPGSLVDLKA